mmetsp:Transcript_118208/g.378751  ORF Transcript_118208/g.378751 Transcript_118208/m.378751 type:complete len:221 (-) Transcript_118208:364-1026(-)
MPRQPTRRHIDKSVTSTKLHLAVVQASPEQRPLRRTRLCATGDACSSLTSRVGWRGVVWGDGGEGDDGAGCGVVRQGSAARGARSRGEVRGEVHVVQKVRLQSEHRPVRGGRGRHRLRAARRRRHRRRRLCRLRAARRRAAEELAKKIQIESVLRGWRAVRRRAGSRRRGGRARGGPRRGRRGNCAAELRLHRRVHVARLLPRPEQVGAFWRLHAEFHVH